jgi:hypothetical protein
MEFGSVDISYRHYIYPYSFLGIWIERKMSSVDQVVAERKRRMRRMNYAKDTGKLKISSNLNLLRFPLSTESDQKGNAVYTELPPTTQRPGMVINRFRQGQIWPYEIDH